MIQTSPYKIPEVGLYVKEKITLNDRPVLNSKVMVDFVMNKVEYFQKHIDFKEMFYVLYVNKSIKLLSILRLSEGSDSDTCVSVKQILQGAVLQNATGVILVHNHPSGNVQPSKEDISLTNQIKKCLKMFDIELIDHVIISEYDTFSFFESVGF